MTRSTHPPTIYDVARRAGVSQATVSYVLHGRRSGKARISEATRQRVLAAMDELGYMPNDTARSLRRRRTDRLCLVIARLGSPYSDALAADVQRVAADHGYSLVLAVGGTAERGQRVVAQLQRGLADGAIIDTGAVTADLLDPLIAANYPLVVTSNHLAPRGFDVVQTSEAEASCEAVSYLLERGHRRVAILTHAAPRLNHDYRYDSYAHALTDRGLPIDQDLVRDGAESRQHAFEAVVALLRLPQRPTAIFSESDIGAISALWAAHEVGLRVPDDVAVIGVGNVPEGDITRPPLTTVGPSSMDFTDVADLLISRLAGKAPDEGRVLIRTWSLIHRGSA